MAGPRVARLPPPPGIYKWWPGARKHGYISRRSAPSRHVCRVGVRLLDVCTLGSGSRRADPHRGPNYSSVPDRSAHPDLLGLEYTTGLRTSVSRVADGGFVCVSDALRQPCSTLLADDVCLGRWRPRSLGSAMVCC